MATDRYSTLCVHLITGISVRQRKLSTIPAMSTLAVYAEEQLRIPFARHTFELNGGIRASQMLNLPTSYTMHGHWYFRPTNEPWVVVSTIQDR